MEKKIKVLEINNIDLPGRRFNGYDLIEFSQNIDIDVKQAVIHKQSKNPKVKPILKNQIQMEIMNKLENFESENLSIHSNLSITSPALIDSREYKEADVLHFHMFHNTKLSLISLLQICSEKKVVMSFHDPWNVTGRCAHFRDCNKWKTGCNNCENLNTLFPFKNDNCNSMWKLKEKIYKNINPQIIVPSQYMYDLLKESPLTNHFTNISIIPLGVDIRYFSNEVGQKEARKKLNIPEDNVVLFLRSQMEFKGTQYILEALKMLNTTQKITIVTCEEKGNLNEVKDKYNIVDLGNLNTQELLYAYNACDMFLMPSIGETFGLMAVEAMACSKPVIVFNNTALPDVTYAPDCGVLVENKNSKELMKAIEYLINNEEERLRRGALGRKICEEKYDVNRYNEELMKVYSRVINCKQHNNSKGKLNSKIDYKGIEAKKIQSKLNEFTKSNFKSNTEIYKKLIYDVENIDDNNNNNIDYSDIDVQKIINEYNNKLYLLISKVKINNIFIKIKNALKMLIKDRERLKNSIQYKINQIFNKKD